MAPPSPVSLFGWGSVSRGVGSDVLSLAGMKHSSPAGKQALIANVKRQRKEESPRHDINRKIGVCVTKQCLQTPYTTCIPRQPIGHTLQC
ncbi:hypothetical protein GYMLUDRAFT_45325, partial [Collybiopsis luxurians FD-317 M1]